MAKQDLTAQELRARLHYDPESGVFTWKARPASCFPSARLARSWHTRRCGKPAGTVSKTRHIIINFGKEFYLAHRLAWLYVHGEWPQFAIDHINGDGSDNRISNLRDVPQTTNMQNLKRARVDNVSGFLGVCRAKQCKLWKAQIRVNGRQTAIGLFATPEEAHKAYLEAKRRFHEGCTI